MPRYERFLLLAGGIALIAALAACRGSESKSIDLEVNIVNGFGRVDYELTCDPPEGNMPRPRALCALVAANAAKMLEQHEPRTSCFGGVLTVHLHVSGRFHGRTVDDDVSSCTGNPEGERLWLRELTNVPGPKRVTESPRAVRSWAEREGFAGNTRAVAGAKIFAEAGCLNCHTYLGTGASNLGAPDLSAIGAKSTAGAEGFATYVADPAKFGNNVMPKFADLGQANLRKLGAFLEASKGSEP